LCGSSESDLRIRAIREEQSHYETRKETNFAYENVMTERAPAEEKMDFTFVPPDGKLVFYACFCHYNIHVCALDESDAF